MDKGIVLVTGAFGVLGRSLVNALINREYTVIALKYDYHKVNNENEKINHIVSGDINDLDLIKRIISDYDVDHIFHLAAKTMVKSSSINPVECYRTNVIGTVNILEAARMGRVKSVICMESDKSYGISSGSEFYHESDCLNPIATYEVSKACSGLIARSYNACYDVPTVCIRSSNIYGPGDFNTKRIIVDTIARLLQSTPPTIYKSSKNFIREYTYCDDVANILILLSENINKSRGHVFNVSSGSAYSVIDIVNIIQKIMNKNFEIIEIKKPVDFHEIPVQRLNTDKLDEYIGKYKYTSLESGLNKTIRWFKETYY